MMTTKKMRPYYCHRYDARQLAVRNKKNNTITHSAHASLYTRTIHGAQLPLNVVEDVQ